MKGMMKLPSNSRNTTSAARRTFLSLLEYKCDREGTHFVAVNPHGTTKECASCGVSTEKPLWIREHSCPACGFEADRDENAAINILFSRFEPARDGTSRTNACGDCAPCGYTCICKARSPDVVWRAVRLTESDNVVEAGSPTLNERTASAVSE